MNNYGQQDGTSVYCSFGEAGDFAGRDIRPAPPKRRVRKIPVAERVDVGDLRHSASYLLALAAMSGVQVTDCSSGLELTMDGLFEVQCTIASLEGVLSRHTQQQVPICDDEKYEKLARTASAYRLAVSDYLRVHPVALKKRFLSFLRRIIPYRLRIKYIA